MDMYMLPLFLLAAIYLYNRTDNVHVNDTPLNDDLRGLQPRNTAFMPS